MVPPGLDEPKATSPPKHSPFQRGQRQSRRPRCWAAALHQ